MFCRCRSPRSRAHRPPAHILPHHVAKNNGQCRANTTRHRTQRTAAIVRRGHVDSYARERARRSDRGRLDAQDRRSETPPARARVGELVVGEPALGTDRAPCAPQVRAVRPRSSAPAGFGERAHRPAGRHRDPGEHVDHRQPQPPALHRRLAGDPAQPRRAAFARLPVVPAHDDCARTRTARSGRRRARSASAPSTRDDRPSGSRTPIVKTRAATGSRAIRRRSAAPRPPIAPRRCAIAHRPLPSLTVTASPARIRSTRRRWCSSSSRQRGRSSDVDEDVRRARRAARGFT